MRPVKALIAGFGTVGRSLIEIMIEQGLTRRINVVGVADSQGVAVSRKGFTEAELASLLKTKRGRVSEIPGFGIPGLSVIEALEDTNAEVLVELTPSNYVTGEPGVTHVFKAVETGVHIVTANKAPLALKGPELLHKAGEAGVLVKYRATVMGGTPLIPLLASIKDIVISVKGVLNASTNFVLSLMSQGLDFKEAVSRASKAGVLEADPSLDLDGWDPAAKLVIISLSLGKPIGLGDVHRVSLRKTVIGHGKGVTKYIAYLRLSNGLEAYVKPMVLNPSDRLASVVGKRNAVYIKTRENDIYLEGLGGGGRVTAEGVLQDLLELAREVS